LLSSNAISPVVAEFLSGILNKVLLLTDKLLFEGSIFNNV
jgi:hypothetical protein